MDTKRRKVEIGANGAPGSVLGQRCTSLSALAKSIASKAKGDPSSVRDELLAAMTMVTDIKRVVRQCHKSMYMASQATSKEQEKLDLIQVQLQNVSYEKHHLEKETQRCLNFKSRHKDIDLIPDDEFRAANPEIVATTDGDAHKYMLARLDHELQARKRLQAEHEAVQTKKIEVEQMNLSKRDKLSKLPQHLNKILKAATPLEKYIGSEQGVQTITKSSPEAYLPPAMYILFVYLHEFRKVHGQIEIEVVGDMSAATSAQTVAEWEPNTDAAREQQQDNDEAEEDGEDEANESRHSRAENEAFAKQKELEEKQARLLLPHPLQVKAVLDCENNAKITLTFSYVTQLKVVTVVSELSRSISVPHNVDILGCLFPDDGGNELPTAASAMIMDQLNMNPFSDYIEKVGRPYRWAQVIAGMSGADLNASTVKSRTAHRSMVTVLTRIKECVAASNSLALQLKSLENLKLEVDHNATAHLFPKASAISKLKKWKLLASDDSDRATLFKYDAVLSRDNIELNARFKVSMVYPSVPPSVTLSFGSSTNGDNANLRVIENEVNIHFDELFEGVSPTLLLTHQLRRLQMCFDVYCEATGLGAADSHMYERNLKGRDRLHPYCFNQQTQKFVHR